MTDLICGVDVSSRTLDARIGPDGPAARFARDPAGIARLAAFCRRHGAGLVAMEATGGYERLPFCLLWSEGLACALANPRQVRRFAEAMGTLEKTDRIDAGVIAAYAAARALRPQAPQSAAQEKLRSLARRLGQLVALKVAQANQRRLVEDPDVLASIDKVVALALEEARAIEARIAALIAHDPLWRRLDQAFREIKGVAGRTVARLMSALPEIGSISGKAAAKLAGLAPIARDSGAASGRRRIRGGRAEIRTALVVVAEIVRRHEPDFAAFHAKLIAAGKPRMAVRVALARKLLVRLNAKARDARTLHAQSA